jgi:hypothetical protein
MADVARRAIQACSRPAASAAVADRARRATSGQAHRPVGRRRGDLAPALGHRTLSLAGRIVRRCPRLALCPGSPGPDHEADAARRLRAQSAEKFSDRFAPMPSATARCRAVRTGRVRLTAATCGCWSDGAGDAIWNTGVAARHVVRCWNLLEQHSLLHGIPSDWVHGRFDAVCPPANSGPLGGDKGSAAKRTRTRTGRWRAIWPASWACATC